MANVSPLAFVHPTAEIADGVEVGPFSYIGEGVKVGRNTRVLNNVSIFGPGTEIGRGNIFYPSCSIGAEPQDLTFHGEPARCIIGDFNTFRECCQVNRGTLKGGLVTQVGNHNLIMACVHVAHDCVIEDGTVIANNTLLGGHVKVESAVTLAGAAVVHHFVTLGRLAFVGGMTRVAKDVPPFMTLEGNPPKVWCVNKVGCERRGVSREALRQLKEAHRLLFRADVRWEDAFRELESRGRDLADEVRYLIAFLRRTELGRQGRAREALRTPGPAPQSPGVRQQPEPAAGRAVAAAAADGPAGAAGTAIGPAAAAAAIGGGPTDASDG